MRAQPIAAAMAAIGALLLSACSDDEPGNAEPSDNGTADVTTDPGADDGTGDDGGELPRSGAPKVEAPIEDTKAFQDDPCLLLTPDDLDELGLPHEGEFADTATGPECEWSDSESQASVAPGFEILNADGLSTFYEQQEIYDLFEEMEPLGGNPVLAHSSATGREDDCAVSVGITDELVLTTWVTFSQENRGTGQDACVAAHTVSGTMLDNIRGGN